MFDNVARLIYDCLQWRRQHQHYRDNVRLIRIPTAVKEDVHTEEVKLKASIQNCLFQNILIDFYLSVDQKSET